VGSPGSGWGPVAGCCECGDEPFGSGATELVSLVVTNYAFPSNETICHATKLLTSLGTCCHLLAATSQCPFTKQDKGTTVSTT
jgi:hypothetical protein